MANIPKDPVMLLSYLNTQLRDFYPDMDELCRALDLDRKTVDEAMASIDYAYDSAKPVCVRNQQEDEPQAGKASASANFHSGKFCL